MQKYVILFRYASVGTEKYVLIPLLSFPITTTLIVFQIFEQRRTYSNRKGVGFIRSYRNEAGRHLETMEVSRDVTCQVGYFMCVKVVCCIEVEAPVFCWLDVPIETERMGDTVVVLHLIRIECTIS